MGLEPRADLSLLLLGLRDVPREGGRELRIAGHRGRPAQLGQGLLLDRVDVGQVLGELRLDVVGHSGSSMSCRSPLQYPTSTRRAVRTSSGGRIRGIRTLTWTCL